MRPDDGSKDRANNGQGIAPGGPLPLELTDRSGCYDADDNRAYGGPHDGGVLDVTNADANTIMFRFGGHLGPGKQDHCAGLYHVYQKHVNPVHGVGDAWVYVGVKTQRDMEQGR